MGFSHDELVEIRTLMKEGLTPTEIWRRRNDRRWAISSVYLACKRIQNNGGIVIRKAGSGRPRSIRIPEIIEKVGRLAISPPRLPNTHLSQRKIARALGISRTSVQRVTKKDLNKELSDHVEKLKVGKKVKVHFITPNNEEVRAMMCRRMLGGKFKPANSEKLLVATDEKYFTLQGVVIPQNERVYYYGKKRDIAPERLLLPVENFPKKLMVWAGISWRGKIGLHIFEENETLNGDRYRQLLEEKIVPACQMLYPEGNLIYLQDGAKAHTANETRARLQEAGIIFLDRVKVTIDGKEKWVNEFPPCSPDLNPCDYRLWAYLEQMIYRNGTPRNLNQLKQRIQEAWDRLDLTTIRKWMREFKPRLEKCVEQDGKHIQQFFNKI